ncbi:MAG TPA: hypothetical protein VK427_16055, partial [Kofleriaceae bacterium]|nr:hypothetical protein [Kofleriaceae bacterium]
MDAHHLADLCDRTDWIEASIGLQFSQDEPELQDAFGRVAVLQHRIDHRARTHELPFPTFATRLSLSETEQQIVMLLVAMRARPDVRSRIQQRIGAAELSLDAIRTLIYGSQPSRLALRELSSD